MNTSSNTSSRRDDRQTGPAVYVPFHASRDNSSPTLTLERLARSGADLATTLPACIAAAHLRGPATPPDLATRLVDALVADSAPRAALTDALCALGVERGVALLRRALRLTRDVTLARDIALPMLALAFGDTRPGAAALTLEQHLAVATLAQHPTLFTDDTAWLATTGLPTTREGLDTLVVAIA